MAKQNRVSPFGHLVAVEARGTVMGNRGNLHDRDGNIIRSYARKPWISCKLEYAGRHREVMAPGQYTELFFLDEATALAAGHRPCGTCERDRLKEFRGIWSAEHPHETLSLEDIDNILHEERMPVGGARIPWNARSGELPSGSLFVFDSEGGSVWLVWEGKAHLWSHQGYVENRSITGDEKVGVLTPPSIVALMRRGYLPKVHPTAELHIETKPISYRPHELRADMLLAGVNSRSSDGQDQIVSSLPASKPSAVNLHKLATTPRGRDLAVYFAAILRVTGMDCGEAFPLKKFLGNFSGHLTAGRIERSGDGYRLTSEGMGYFKEREARQGISGPEIQSVVLDIEKGGAGWVRI